MNLQRVFALFLVAAFVGLGLSACDDDEKTKPPADVSDTTETTDTTDTVDVPDVQPDVPEETELPPAPVCGNGVIEGAEACDDGNTDDGDGCSALCEIEAGWVCVGEPSECEEASSIVCGDGVIQVTEACDDGNTDAGDGCSATCAVEDGWICEGEPSVCTEVVEAECGDGVIEGDEECDDGDTDANDGCSATCTIEEGWICAGEPSVCVEEGVIVCGDGKVEGDEECDDGDTEDGDGCSATCTIEEGFDCYGEPSICAPALNPDASAQIAAVWALCPEGTCTDPENPLPIEAVAVTYVKAEIGNDPAGFFVQAEQMGPALFVRVANVSVAAGDVVSFNVVAVELVQGRIEVTETADFDVLGHGSNLSALAQDISAKDDLMTATTDYLFEYVEATVTISGDRAGSGTGYVTYAVDTVGITGDASLLLRLPGAFADAIGLQEGCQLHIGPTPLWRYAQNEINRVQISVWELEEISAVTNCMAELVDVNTPDATTVELVFNRDVHPASVSAGVFVIPELTVTDAAVDGRVITLTTGAQEPAKAYDLTISDTLVDVLGLSLGTTAGFSGFRIITWSFTETFDASTAGNTYNNGSFTGVNNVLWTWTHCRNEDTFAIDDKGLILRRAQEPSSLSATLSGGIGDVAFDVRKAYTGDAERRLEVLVNDVVMETFAHTFATGTDATVRVVSKENINCAGDCVLLIRVGPGNDGTNRQVVIDNVRWTTYTAP